MKIAVFEIKKWEREYLSRALPEHEFHFFRKPLSLDNIEKVADAEAISVFIYSKINQEILDKLPNLKIITTRSTGFDHIDLNACKSMGINVCNVPTYGENTVAEHTFALIMALSRKVHKAYVKVQRNEFTLTGLKGFDLKGKTIGVIGAGHIGLHVIRIAKGFGMNVLVNARHQDVFLSEVMGFQYASFDDLLSQSDIISLHLPLNDATHHMINKNNIHQIKKGAVLINTSRGGLIETDALIEALDQKIISGVGLDVIEGEEYIMEEKELLSDKSKIEVIGNIVKNHLLFQRDNVVFTPHSAFYSQEALERILETTIDNFRNFSSGKIINSVYESK